MKKLRFFPIIRYIFSLLLVYLVYTETGIWTSAFVLLSLISSEIQFFTLHMQDKKINNIKTDAYDNASKDIRKSVYERLKKFNPDKNKAQ